MNNAIKKAKEDFIIAAHRAYKRGIQMGNGGNISVRIPNEDLMVIKPKGISFIECSLDNLVVTNFDGKVMEGNLQPTREALLHGTLYKQLPDIGGIVHCHSPWSITWSFTKKNIPLLTQHAKLKLKHTIPNLSIDAPVISKKEVPMIINLFEKHEDLPAFVLEGHGIVSVGEDVVKAEHVAELVEETAQIACLHTAMRSIQ